MAQATDQKVDSRIEGETRWGVEFTRLRALILDCGLSETLKWGQPCYTLDGANIVLIHGFKDYCALLFFKGALLKDESGVLIQQTENVQAARQIRFTGLDGIARMDNLIKAYVHQAIEVEKAGLKVDFKTTDAFTMPDEFRARLDADAGLKDAFEALTPGRQRAYLLHFSSAKQAKTREARIDKAVPQILDGKGLDD
ncbi:YdeI/OmpD-associated family protein [Asticcacaulis sp. BYS171W]|uniref:YdeI/OmpD-associated family protein n=1 Tax=Asticcacaulis aquaticus TaxID=2984212 RepID=A0ABT5HXX6_9CAUL|nr:YdeI/OmpD-associated family protein [Asticcacaulis aquaticus]MDC7684834.1 YdeI/OmpD-associated family protein [Asticcacaulis aquaticus]